MKVPSSQEKEYFANKIGILIIKSIVLFKIMKLSSLRKV